MTELEWIRWALMIVFGGFIWMLKRELTIKDSEIVSIKTDIQNLKDTRLHKEDFKEFKQELHAMFETLRQDIRALRDQK